jgi:hypothetical protein
MTRWGACRALSRWRIGSPIRGVRRAGRLELAEHRAAGLGPAETLAQPAVLLGLVAQVWVAAVLYLIVRTSHEAGAVVATTLRRAAALVVRPSWRPGRTLSVAVIVPVSSLSRRGPPPRVLVSSI